MTIESDCYLVTTNDGEIMSLRIILDKSSGKYKIMNIETGEQMYNRTFITPINAYQNIKFDRNIADIMVV